MSERRRPANPKHGPAPVVTGNVQDSAIRSELARIAKATNFALEDVRETWSERAAIREYLGGVARNVAETRALVDTVEILEHRRSF